MSDITHWTNLPKEIKPDFVSYDTDYDYPLYLSEKEEWVNYKDLKNVKGKVSVSGPFLIMELNRFVPYLEDKHIKFHALNMPHIKIGKIEIVGFVISTRTDSTFFIHQIDDGTGTIAVYYRKDSFTEYIQQRKGIDEKYKSLAKNIDAEGIPNEKYSKRFPNPHLPNKNDASTSNAAKLEHNWALETNNGLLGTEVKRGDYVHVMGYCSLDFMCGKKPQNEITVADLYVSKLTFFASKVNRIAEHEYNTKLSSWFNTIVRKRYDEHPNEPETFPNSTHLRNA